MAVAFHLVASTRLRERALADPERAQWLWIRLRRGFPEALSNLLMPDHLHLVGREDRVDQLKRLLGTFARRWGTRFEVLPAQPLMSAAIARRSVRYGLLNPVHAGLVDDPWLWSWSTLRDLHGAVAEPWTRPSKVATALGPRGKRLLTAVTHTADARPELPGTGIPEAIRLTSLVSSDKSQDPMKRPACPAISPPQNETRCLVFGEGTPAPPRKRGIWSRFREAGGAAGRQRGVGIPGGSLGRLSA